MFMTTASDLVLALQDTSERLSIQLTDTTGPGGTTVPVNATVLSFELRSLCGHRLVRDNLFATGTRIVQTGPGAYYFPLGDQSVAPNRETACSGDFLGIWHIAVGTEADNIVQSIKIVAPYMFEVLGRLRRQLDKSMKLVVEDPANPCYLGYTDKALIEFLESGLTIINAYQPYPTFSTVADFPRVYLQILIDAAMVVGVCAQELFAIDQDIPNYSSQGAAFVIQHQPQLAAFAARISQSLDKQIPLMKQHLTCSGSLHTEISPNYRLATLVSMSPPGALFRNLFLAGA